MSSCPEKCHVAGCPCREWSAKSPSETYYGHLRLDTGGDLAIEGAGNPQPDPQDLFRASEGVVSPQTPNSPISVNGHLLYTEQNCSVFHDSDKQCPVHEGGLAVCRLCNEYEAGLDKSCVKSESPVVVAPTFTEEWESAPRAMIRYVEQDRIRAVLFDVIDGGCTCDSGEQHPWELDHNVDNPEIDEDIVNAQRVRFVDEVMGRLLISPSMAEYWFLRGVQAGETSAMVTMNEDLREIRRVAGERL